MGESLAAFQSPLKLVRRFPYNTKTLLILDVCEHGELRLDPLNQVETCQDGVWTNVDGEDNWTMKESSVACKQMGYSQYGTAEHINYRGAWHHLGHIRAPMENY